MGVFARFLRRSKGAEATKDTLDTSAREKAADTQAVEPEAGNGSGDGAPEATPAKSTADGATEASEVTGATGAEKAEAPSEAAAAEGVEIPRQQSAGEAADREAGEGARK
ncbi:hypothetical protein [Streptomyces sp. NPDC014894]|uniref:hypothetical protein n=1 Tax=Streptomyces sp. NPDC014894 TaxID=3364931 RepID=UPI0036FAA953